MKHRRLGLLVLIGCALLISGMSLLTVEGTLYAHPAAQREGEFIGAGECTDCHKGVEHSGSSHDLALQSTERSKDPILGDFTQGEDLRTVQFPGADAPRAFTADDIRYAIGSGHYTQAYVYEAGDEDYRVFPAVWNIVTGEWVAYTLADNWDDPAYNFVTQCAGCHTTGLNLERVRWEDDGVQCEACHGPGESHFDEADAAGRNADEEELQDIRSAINPGIDPQVCGQCHSRGTTADNTTAHPRGYYPGGDLTADAGYTLFGPDDTAHWYSTGHASQANMQYNEWVNSGHAASLTSLQESEYKDDSCLTCHSGDYRYNADLIALAAAGEREGAPAALTVDTALYGVTCTTCHDPHSDAETPAYLVSEPYALCVSCHSQTNITSGDLHHPVQEMFEGKDVVEGISGIPGGHFTSANGPDCLTCHVVETPISNGTRASHSLQPVLPGVALNEPGVVDSCSVCHEDQATPALMQDLIDVTQASTLARLETARGRVTDSTPAWVTQALDFVEGDGSAGIHNYAYTDELLDAVDIALGIPPAAVEQ